MKTKDAVEHLSKELKKDKEYRETWKANISMSFVDSISSYKRKTGKKSLSNEDLYTIANMGAEAFLNLLCDEVKYPKGR